MKKGNPDKIGANAPCPCGQGRKYKRCCRDKPGSAQRTPSEQTRGVGAVAAAAAVGPSEHLTRRVRALVESWDRIRCDNSESTVAYDATYRIGFHSYRQLVDEICEERHLMLLPSLLSMDNLRLEDIDDDTVMDIGRLLHQPIFTEFEVFDFNPHESELRAALECDDFSFSLPAPGFFPVVIRELPRAGYTPQFVANFQLFSPSTAEWKQFSIVCQSRGSSEEFLRQQSFVHEFIHVMQRVLRKTVVPAYEHRLSSGTVTFRNPAALVRTGIEDEIEVQRILVLAGYDFKIWPIIHHKMSLVSTLACLPSVEAAKAMRDGLDQIPFDKYRHLHDGRLREVVFEAYLTE